MIIAIKFPKELHEFIKNIGRILDYNFVGLILR